MIAKNRAYDGSYPSPERVIDNEDINRFVPPRSGEADRRSGDVGGFELGMDDFEVRRFSG